jgi:hypothetical protein
VTTGAVVLVAGAEAGAVGVGDATGVAEGAAGASA